MILVDLPDFLDPVGLVLVMREPVMTVRDANFAIGPIGALARHHERHHAGLVGLQRERHQVKHEARVFGVVHRHARGLFKPWGKRG